MGQRGWKRMPARRHIQSWRDNRPHAESEIGLRVRLRSTVRDRNKMPSVMNASATPRPMNIKLCGSTLVD